MVEEGHANFERVRHAGDIHLEQDVFRQVGGLVHVEPAVDRVGAGVPHFERRRAGGKLEVRGVAFSGAAAISQVEVSIDDGKKGDEINLAKLF